MKKRKSDFLRAKGVERVNRKYVLQVIYRSKQYKFGVRLSGQWDMLEGFWQVSHFGLVSDLTFVQKDSVRMIKGEITEQN